jgi:hypothetical protein
MSKPNFQVLDYLASKGVRFVVGEGEAKHSGYFVEREQIEEFLDDPDALFARFNGVTKFEYRDWRDAGRSLHCSARTRNGKPCRFPVKGGFFLTAEQWVARQGEYCPRHTEGTASGVRGLPVRAS